MTDVPDTTPETAIAPSYPVDLMVEYPDRDLNRLTTAFRIFTVIPIAIILSLLTTGIESTSGVIVTASSYVALPTLLMLLFRQKYPRWWFDWNLGLAGFSYRVGAYLALLRDEYPATDDDQAVHVTMVYPDARTQLNRWLPLVKWLLAIPHYVVLFFLGIALFVCVIIAWFAILFTGRYPRSLFNFVLGVERWSLRVVAYAILLVTDDYPPFRLAS
jgi:hypothetical protein